MLSNHLFFGLPLGRLAKFRQAKKDFEKKLAKQIKSDPKSFYAYVRSKSKTRDVIGPLRDSSNNLVTHDAKMCDVLNSFLFRLCVY